MGTAGYADVNGLRLYYEVHGTGDPIVLLHGGMLSIKLNYVELIPWLAEGYQVIAVELQGHGRTADIDRDITAEHLAGDVVALLDHLDFDRAMVLGHDLGASVALELAVHHRSRVRAVVAMSATAGREGVADEVKDPERFATSQRRPSAKELAAVRAEYERLSPHPERFESFRSRVAECKANRVGLSDAELRAIACPVLIVQGDRDYTTVDHAAHMLDLIPSAELAILPGTNQLQVTRRTELLLPILRRYLSTHG